MNKIRITLLATSLLVVFGSNLLASDRWETLQAINWVENPRNSPKPGPHGELGPYQFMERTWHMHTRMPFSMAIQREQADEVAIMHYEWIRKGLERNGLAVTPYNIALAWNAGLGAVVNGRIGGGSREYARQVVNLVDELNQNQVASISGK